MRARWTPVVVVGVVLATASCRPVPAPPPSIVEQIEQRYPDDVLGGMTVPCAPRNDDEWYRTGHTLAIDPTNPKVMYVAVEWLGVFKTVDGGASWTKTVKGIKGYGAQGDPKRVCHGEYPTIRIDPDDSRHVVLVVSGGGGHLSLTEPNSQTGGLYHSLDGGATWRLMIGAGMNLYATDATFGPTPGSVYYASSSNPASWQGSDQNKLYVTKGLIYSSANDGRSWSELPTGLGKLTSATRVLADPTDPNRLVAPTFSAVRLSSDGSGTGVSNGKDLNVAQMGILKSVDGGRTWISMAGSTGSAYTNAAASPQRFEHQYFTPSMSPGAKLEGYYTLDGATLRATSYMDVVAYDPFDTAGMRLIGFSSANVGPASDNLTLHQSLDGGATWSRFGTLPSEISDPAGRRTRVSAITWHPTEPQTIFLNGAGGHVWKSIDGGQTWQTLLTADALLTT